MSAATLRAAIAAPAPAWGLSAAQIGRAATLALHDELALAPKPGLVSFVDSGSHDDMDAHTFMRSLFSLRRYFVRMAELGAAQVPFAELERSGIAAEARMLAATGGINTHRGAIFVLGLLCAATGAAQALDGRRDADAVREHLRRHWGGALDARSQRAPTLPGGIAARRHGLRSASQEAALGFPVLFETALPAWDDARRRGLSAQQVRLDCFFSILAVLDDSNLAHRGGLEGLHFARRAARAFIEQGGAGQPGAPAAAWSLHRDFVARHLSPGGCADLLAAACFLRRVAREP
ncbi:triphosphoribosyl-dephospho-CoA synthase [Azohydromonas caseinilytica]|uniref:Probable 2-(5''-triphosphoribosyl)-3'-dephosphocoenzyme-A synthase n=1 Tax=Azohydromonas caseinilytica TaxID=2728836 RepID=A0A848FDX6_9BURK|nr:triphosphoribosyl-dephospho-CoA synthase [Azohydromonas caseinilytica]NML16483.1 triphosphoribosyl-dephospho-CoA synthase MdcB [Azohydromonas caseinilytica]